MADRGVLGAVPAHGATAKGVARALGVSRQEANTALYALVSRGLLVVDRDARPPVFRRAGAGAGGEGAGGEGEQARRVRAAGSGGGGGGASAVLEGAVFECLRQRGEWTTAAEVVGSLKKAGVLPRDATRQATNQALAQLVRSKHVARKRDADASAIPAFRSLHMERTAEDDLRELAQQHGLRLELRHEAVSHPFIAAADRYRATVRLAGLLLAGAEGRAVEGGEEEGQGLEAASRLVRSPDAANADACHAMLRKLAGSKRLRRKGLAREANRRFHLAYKRGHFLARLEQYTPPVEDWHLEFKGSHDDSATNWDLRKGAKGSAALALSANLRFFPHALNTWLMLRWRDGDDGPVEDPKLVLGVHDNGTTHGVRIKSSANEGVFKTTARVLVEDLRDMAVKVLTERVPGLSWGLHLRVEWDQLWSEHGHRSVAASNGDPVDFFVLLTVVVDAAELLAGWHRPNHGPLRWAREEAKYRDGARARPCPPQWPGT